MQPTQGYSPKDLVFGDDGRKRLISGIEKLSNAVKSTLGPSGNTVLIESLTHTHGITVTKDGVTVAKSIDLIDPIENLAVKMMKEAADRTATEAGDGTTSSIVLAEALVKAGFNEITEDLNRTEVLRSMVEISAKVVEKLKSGSKRVNHQILFDVATVSANNDKRIGHIIADTYKAVGKTGVVTVGQSPTEETYAEVTTGIKIDRGYSSPMFINNQRRDECVLEDAMVLVCDIEITNLLNLQAALAPLITAGKKLLIISPAGTNAINTLAANVIKGTLKACIIPPPSSGYRQHELMQDIAVALGATYFSSATGDDLTRITAADMGRAEKVVVDKSRTTIVRYASSEEHQERIDQRVAELRQQYAEAKKKSDKDFLLERIASLTGGVGVIFVGGNTDLERKELQDRVEDSVCAVRSALEEGVVSGAGKALYEIQVSDLMPQVLTKEQWAAVRIMGAGLGIPLKQILENAGLSIGNCYPEESLDGEGYNLKTGRYGNLIQMGVVDPLKVTRSALENAVSVAVTILSTNAIVTMARSYDTTN